MSPQMLSRIMQMQRRIEARELDLNGTLQMIAEQVRSAADATGCAIALLKTGQLVYGAGSGSAAAYVGRSVAATISISASQMDTEILRVEDADHDPRIQSAICRQFGAKALLILPVRSKGSLAAVLQIIFDSAHFFSDQEIRGYWIFAGLIGEAIRSCSHKVVKEKAVNEVVLADAVGQIHAPAEQNQVARFQPVVIPPTPTPLPSELEPTVLARSDAPVSDLEPVSNLDTVSNLDSVSDLDAISDSVPVLGLDPVSDLAPVSDLHAVSDLEPVSNTDIVAISPIATILDPDIVRSRWFPAQVISVFYRAWDAGIAVAIVAALVSLTLYRDRPAKISPVRVTDKLNSVQTPTPVASGIPAADTSAVEPPVQRPSARVQRKLALASNVGVRHFGEDVTIRYFTPNSALVRADARQNEVRRFSDDVTVRYFKPREATVQSNE